MQGTHGEVPVGIFPYLPWNLLDMLAGIAPVSQVTKEDDEKMKKEYPTSNMVYYLKNLTE